MFLEPLTIKNTVLQVHNLYSFVFMESFKLILWKMDALRTLSFLTGYFSCKLRLIITERLSLLWTGYHVVIVNGPWHVK